MIELLTDSTCDLPQPLLEQYHITVLAHFIIWGSQQFRDRVDLQPADFYRRFFETIDPRKPFQVALSHGDAPDEAVRLIERIQQETHPQEILTNITGPVLGINTGPRALALAGYNE